MNLRHMKEILKHRLAAYLDSDTFDSEYILVEELGYDAQYRKPTQAEINRMNRAKYELSKKLIGE